MIVTYILAKCSVLYLLCGLDTILPEHWGSIYTRYININNSVLRQNERESLYLFILFI